MGWNQQMDENLQPPSKWGANSGDGRTKEAASRPQTRAALRHTLPSRMCSIALKELSHTFNSSEQEYSTDTEHQNIRYFFPCFLKVISGSEKNKKRSIIFLKKMCVCVCVCSTNACNAPPSNTCALGHCQKWDSGLCKP